MRGELHQRLITLLRDQKASGAFTQESLAKAVHMHQTTVSGILHKNAGTFDLDEAAAALQHIGSSLDAFIAGIPPQSLTAAERLARLLLTSDRLPLLAALLDVPESRWPDVVLLINAFGLKGRTTASGAAPESPSAPTRPPRKKRARAPRR